MRVDRLLLREGGGAASILPSGDVIGISPCIFLSLFPCSRRHAEFTIDSFLHSYL